MCDGEKTVSLASGSGKAGQPHINQHSLTPYTELNSKQLKDLNIKQDTIKLLQENIGKTFSDINCTSVYLGQSPKAIEIKVKINKWNLIKLISFCTTKETRHKMKRQPMEWKKIFADGVTGKGFISKIHKQLMQPYTKKQTTQSKNGQKI